MNRKKNTDQWFQLTTVKQLERLILNEIRCLNIELRHAALDLDDHDWKADFDERYEIFDAMLKTRICNVGSIDLDKPMSIPMEYAKGLNLA